MREKIEKLLKSTRKSFTAAQVGRRFRISAQCAFKHLNSMRGLKKRKVRQGARGPKATSWGVR